MQLTPNAARIAHSSGNAARAPLFRHRDFKKVLTTRRGRRAQARALLYASSMNPGPPPFAARGFAARTSG
jgi:hypothetical protein